MLSELETTLADPIPQIGAVLDLDTALKPPDHRQGNKHWRLRGSCALMAPNRVLTISHLLDRQGEAAVFFPFHGIFRLSDTLSREPQARGDNMVLAELLDKVDGLAPLRHALLASAYQDEGVAEVCGFGRWSGEAAVAPDGLQRRARVRLGPPARTDQPDWRGYDRLDISWSSHENGLAAGRANSGGPMLSQDGKIVGVSRESRGDQQAGSWIRDLRDAWLRNQLNGVDGAASTTTLETKCDVVTVGAAGLVREFDTPEGTRSIYVTLNATAGLRLQMRVVPGTPPAALDGLEDDDHRSGRFLVRSCAVNGERKVTVAIAPVEAAKPLAERVTAQLCLRFEPV